MRMLIEGVVYPAGVALSRGALLWMQSAFAPQVVLDVALVLSVLFAAASGLVGLSFLPSLLRSLRLRAVSPSEYSNLGTGPPLLSIRHSLPSPPSGSRSPQLRTRKYLARRLAPGLLRAEGLGRPPTWEAGATAIGRLAQGLSPEWSAAPKLLVANASTAVRFDGGGADRGGRESGRNATISNILGGDGQRRTSGSKLVLRAALSSFAAGATRRTPPNCSRGTAMRPSAWPWRG